MRNPYVPTILLYAHVSLLAIPELKTREDVIAISLQDQTIYRFQDTAQYRAEKRVSFAPTTFRIIAALIGAAVNKCSLTMPELVDVAWSDDPSGGPDHAKYGVLTRLSLERAKLSYLGIAITRIRHELKEAVFTPPLHMRAAA